MSIIPPDSISVHLDHGYVAFIDHEDADLLHFQWSVLIQHRNKKIIGARRKIRLCGKQKTLLMHRVIMERVLGRQIESSELIDHVDLNPLNNTRKNLRLADFSQNGRNITAHHRNKAGLKGVHFVKHANRYRSQITIHHKRIHLGYFDTPEEAHEAYKQAAIKYHGEFARWE